MIFGLILLRGVAGGGGEVCEKAGGLRRDCVLLICSLCRFYVFTSTLKTASAASFIHPTSPTSSVCFNNLSRINVAFSNNNKSMP